MAQDLGTGESQNGNGRVKPPPSTDQNPAEPGGEATASAAVAIIGAGGIDDGTGPTLATAAAGAPPQPPMSRGWIIACFVYSLVTFIAPLAWVVAERAAAPGAWTDTKTDSAVGALQGLPWIAAVGASMGALHSLASLAVRAGNETLFAPWRVFYFARPFTGAGVAAITFLVLVSGIGGFNVSAPIAHLGWAALAGLYSEQALAKLRDVFAALLKPDENKTAPNGAKR